MTPAYFPRCLNGSASPGPRLRGQNAQVVDQGCIHSSRAGPHDVPGPLPGGVRSSPGTNLRKAQRSPLHPSPATAPRRGAGTHCRGSKGRGRAPRPPFSGGGSEGDIYPARASARQSGHPSVAMEACDGKFSLQVGSSVRRETRAFPYVPAHVGARGAWQARRRPQQHALGRPAAAPIPLERRQRLAADTAGAARPSQAQLRRCFCLIASRAEGPVAIQSIRPSTQTAPAGGSSRPYLAGGARVSSCSGETAAEAQNGRSGWKPRTSPHSGGALVGQLDRPPGFYPGSCGFESCQAHHPRAERGKATVPTGLSRSRQSPVVWPALEPSGFSGWLPLSGGGPCSLTSPLGRCRLIRRVGEIAGRHPSAANPCAPVLRHSPRRSAALTPSGAVPDRPNGRHLQQERISGPTDPDQDGPAPLLSERISAGFLA